MYVPQVAAAVAPWDDGHGWGEHRRLVLGVGLVPMLALVLVFYGLGNVIAYPLSYCYS